MNSGSYRKMTSFLIVKMGCYIVYRQEKIHILPIKREWAILSCGNKMNSNFKSIFFLLKQTWKHIWKFSFFLSCTFGFSESSGNWRATSEAFIFSLNNNEGLAPFVNQVKKEFTDRAIYRNSQFGPYFGIDVIIRDNADSNSLSEAALGYHYSVPPAVQQRHTVLAGTWRFSPDEVEVFYLDPSR